MKTVPKWITMGVLLGGGAGFLLAQTGARDFRPPRTAVVDISRVFESFEKKKQLNAQLEEEGKKAEAEYNDLEGRFRSLEDDIKTVVEGSDEYNRLVLERTKLQLDLQNMRKKLLNEFQEKYLRAATQLRDEITQEIERYSRAHDLALVIEFRFNAEAKNMPPLKWPIVHYVAPEIDITDEIIGILNSQ